MKKKPEKTPDLQFETLRVSDTDYVSPGFTRPDLDAAFPHRIIGDKTNHPWVYLRREVPHHWYVDERNPLMGFLSVDEGAILHSLAKAIPDADALEIGCHRGWSTAHLAAGVRHLDVIDPVLADSMHLADVESSLQNAGLRDRCVLHAGTSPAKLLELAALRAEPWSVIFVDGDHEPDGPLWDAQTVANHAAKDAIVIFHDLASPVVSEGLAYLRSLGWSSMIFQTMQIMGVAWRGNVNIPTHIPDPQVRWVLPDHLRSFRVSGETDSDYATRIQRFFVDNTSMDHHARNTALIPLGLPTKDAMSKDIRFLQAALCEASANLAATQLEVSKLQQALTLQAETGQQINSTMTAMNATNHEMNVALLDKINNQQAIIERIDLLYANETKSFGEITEKIAALEVIQHESINQIVEGAQANNLIADKIAELHAAIANLSNLLLQQHQFLNKAEEKLSEKESIIAGLQANLDMQMQRANTYDAELRSRKSSLKHLVTSKRNL